MVASTLSTLVIEWLCVEEDNVNWKKKIQYRKKREGGESGGGGKQVSWY